MLLNWLQSVTFSQVQFSSCADNCALSLAWVFQFLDNRQNKILQGWGILSYFIMLSTSMLSTFIIHVERLIFSLCSQVSTCYVKNCPLHAWQPKTWQMTTCYCDNSDNSEKWYRPTHHPKSHVSYRILVIYIQLNVGYFQIWLQFSGILGQADPDLKGHIFYCFFLIFFFFINFTQLSEVQQQVFEMYCPKPICRPELLAV